MRPMLKITIYNDNYKFAAYPHNILQEFATKNMVIITIHSEKFSLGTVSQLLALRICPFRILKRITFIIDELDFSWDPDISSVFSGVDPTLSAYALPDLPSTDADVSRRSVLPLPPWFVLDARLTSLRPPPWSD